MDIKPPLPNSGDSPMSIFRTSCPMQGYKVGPKKHFHFEALGLSMFYLVFYFTWYSKLYQVGILRAM